MSKCVRSIGIQRIMSKYNVQVHRIGIEGIMCNYNVQVHRIGNEASSAEGTRARSSQFARYVLYSLKDLLVRVENQLSSCEVETNPRGSCTWEGFIGICWTPKIVCRLYLENQKRQ
jgi:hypothetical protein